MINANLFPVRALIIRTPWPWLAGILAVGALPVTAASSAALQPPLASQDSVPVARDVDIVVPKSGSRYRLGDTIKVRVSFASAQTLLPDARLLLTIGKANRPAHLLPSANDGDPGASSTVHVFYYVVQTGDLDTSGISIAGNAIGLVLADSVKIKDDPRYKVWGDDEIICDDSPTGWAPDLYLTYCNLQKAVAAFQADRVDSTRNTQTDVLNANCEDENINLNRPSVQRALDELDLGREAYCDDAHPHWLVVVDDFLIKSHLVYRRIKDAVSVGNPRRQVAAVGDQIEALLRKEGLYGRVAAFVRIGSAVFSDASDNGRAEGPDGPGASKAYEALWQTKMYEQFVFFGDMGRSPRFALWSSDDVAKCDCSDTVGTTARRFVKAERGVYYNVGVKWYPARYLAAAFFRFGQERMSADTATIPVGDSDNVKAVLEGSRWNTRFDVGLNFQLFDVDSRNVIDYNKKRPALDLEIGIRRNGRYKYEAANDDAMNLSFFDDPQSRLFWRMTIDLPSVNIFSDDDKKDNLLTAVVVVERESDLMGQVELPSTTRVFVFVDSKLNILSFLR